MFQTRITMFRKNIMDYDGCVSDTNPEQGQHSGDVLHIPDLFITYSKLVFLVFYFSLF